MIPSIKSSLGIRPSLFLSIFRNKSVSRDFLWFMNFKNYAEPKTNAKKTRPGVIIIIFYARVRRRGTFIIIIRVPVSATRPTRSSGLFPLPSNSSDALGDDVAVPKPSATRCAICPTVAGTGNYVTTVLPLYCCWPVKNRRKKKRRKYYIYI